MIEYLPLIINIAIVFIAVFWIQSDMEGRGIERRSFWLWTIGIVGGWLLFGIIGAGIVLVVYYFWSRKKSTKIVEK